MYKVLIDDIYHNPEWSEDTIPATDNDLLVLTQRLSHQRVPTKVFFQAIAIAAYDGASAFRYADNYLTSVKHKHKRRNIFSLRKPLVNFDQN
ncbi:hypothetical protein [Nostoc sp. TCL26-01]|uniref:hypothetical protein n=1 Tax=Nostoc sp. TCL26-01 TaxID=2576904 RepID=UPI0015BA35F7|nr:hypothetical protein [Nostoc sp. TCL26-01]QLE55674.1 hypothetical protein FD725_09180 [Nostoc sp. TCL26-01]